MLRLAHRILSQHNVQLDESLFSAGIPTAGGGLISVMDYVRRQLARGSSPVIIADNIADYESEKYKSNNVDVLDLRKFPPCPSPFNECFVEWNEDSMTLGVLQVGCFVQRFTVGEVKKAWRKQAPDEFEGRDDTDWVQTGSCLVTSKQGLALPVASFALCLDKAGIFIEKSLRFGWVIKSEYVKGEPGRFLSVLLSTLAFTHCKNVSRVDVTGNEGPTPKWCRQQRVPELRYQMLEIDPSAGGKQRSDERKTEGDRSGKALHICRGHFAHFVDDGVSQGLFGRKQFGTFWVPSHTRGSLENGQVVSTYHVKAPRSGEGDNNA